MSILSLPQIISSASWREICSIGRHSVKLIPVFLLLWVIAVAAQSDDQPVAVVDGEAITMTEFQARYEGVIWQGKHIENWQDELKVQVLLSMVAERLLADEAQEFNLLNDAATAKILTSLEQALVRDRLYREEIMDKVTISEAEIQEGYEHMAAPRVVRLVRVATPEEVAALQQDILVGGDIDSLAVLLDDTQTRQVTMTWGESPAHVDSVIFSLKVGQTSVPFRWDGLYYFAKLKKILAPAIYDSQDFINKKNHIKQILRARQEQERLREFMPTIMHGQEALIKHETLRPLIEAVSNVVTAYGDSIQNANEPITFNFADLEQVQTALESQINDPIVTFADTAWTVQNLLDRFMIQGLKVIPARPLDRQLVSIIQNHIDKWWLTVEGYRRGLDKHPDVVADLQQWKRVYAANLNRLLFEMEADSTAAMPLLVNVREILTPTLETAQAAWQQLNEGADFAELARELTIRPGAAEHGGELGYFDPREQYTDIGTIALQMEPGERHGPLQVAEGYSIFELIDKDVPPNVALAAFKGTGVSNQGRSALNEHLVELAQQKGVSVDFELLKTIPVTSVNMFTVRYLGFGGSIPAIPQLTPLFEWFKHLEATPAP